MPKILEKCVTKLIKNGKSKSSAYAICTASLQKVGKMSEEEVAEVCKENDLTLDDINNVDESLLDIDVAFNNKFSVMTEIKLGESKEELTEIEMLRSGLFKHTYYGDLVFDEKYFKHLKKNFDNNVIERDISFDREHYITDGAVAWLKEVDVIKRKVNKKSIYYLVGRVKFTKFGKTLIEDELYKYFSIDYTTNFTDKEDDTKTYGPTIYGGAVTNRPYIPGLRPIKIGDKIEMSEKDLETATYEEVLSDKESEEKDVPIIKEKINIDEVIKGLSDIDKIKLLIKTQEVIKSLQKDAAKKKFNDKEEKPLSAKKLLEGQLSELRLMRDNVEKDSDEFKNLSDKIKDVEAAIAELDIKFKELEVKPEEKSEVKPEEKPEVKPEVKPELSEEKPKTEKSEEKHEKEEVKMSEKANEELISLREQLKSNEKEVAILKQEKRKSDIEKTVMQFRQKGVPPVLINFYQEIALADDFTKSVKLTDGDNKGEYGVTDILVKLFEILPKESLIDLSEKSETIIPEDEGAKLVKMASDQAKGKYSREQEKE